MRRRQLLAGAGAGLSTLTSGCLGVDGLLSRPRAPLAVSLTAVDDVGEGHPFVLAAQVENPGMGPEATPELLVGLRSTAEEALFLGHDARWPAGGLLPDRDTEPSGLRLLSTGEVTDFTVEAGACRTTRYRPGDGQLGGHRVAAGDRVRGRFAVLGQGSALGETCPGEGRYRVEATYPYTTERAVREVGFGAAEKQRFRWGFTLVVRERG